MTPSDACRALVASFEGCKLTAYPDPGTGGDPWTIGYGHTGPDVRKGLVWSQAQADAYLASDLVNFGIGVSRLIGDVRTTQSMFDALVSFAFNVGLGNLAGSTLLKKHKAGDYDGAKAQFAAWNKAAGRVLPGLTKRRAAEAAMYGQIS